VTILDLPAVNASLNGLSAVFLLMGFVFIRRGERIAHRNCMIAACAATVAFLACYLTYHTYLAVHLHKGPTVFKNPAYFRPIYLTILTTHTFLAVVTVPLSFVTLGRARKQRYDLHKKIARWTWPIWMYVSVTGVIIYLLLYKIFPQT